MPIKFKCEQKKPFTIEREGTVFFFELDNGILRDTNNNRLLVKKFDYGRYIGELFTQSLFKWENLVDEKDIKIPFTEGKRDLLVQKTDIFDEKDVQDFLEYFKSMLFTGTKEPADITEETDDNNENGDNQTETNQEENEEH